MVKDGYGNLFLKTWYYVTFEFLKPCLPKDFSLFRTLVYVVCFLDTILSVGVQQEVTEENLTFS